MRPLYWFVAFCTRVLFKLLYGMKVEGLENLPGDGAYLIASNHASALDPPAIGATVPREISFFAKKELFSVPVVGWFIDYAGSIPVDRTGYSAGAMRRLISDVKGGRPALIFPEGTRTRTGDFLEPKKGVGMVAAKVGVPIVPCWIEGSYKAKPFRSRMTLHYMPPFHPDDVEAPSKKEQYMLVSKRIMYDITKLHDKHAE